MSGANCEWTSSYHRERFVEFESRAQDLRKRIDEIGRYMTSFTEPEQLPAPQGLYCLILVNLNVSDIGTWLALQQVLRTQHEALISLAARFATLNDALEDLRARYKSFRVRYYNDSSNPFQEVTKKSFAFLEGKLSLPGLVFGCTY